MLYIENLDSFTDIQNLQKQLKSSDIKILTEEDETSEGPASFTIEDPDGNSILVDQYR